MAICQLRKVPTPERNAEAIYALPLLSLEIALGAARLAAFRRRRGATAIAECVVHVMVAESPLRSMTSKAAQAACGDSAAVGLVSAIGLWEQPSDAFV